MFDSNTEIAENKLILLYILRKVGKPISNSQITEIILESNLINYFPLQQYLSELKSSKFLSYKDFNNKKLISITETGLSALSFFMNRIPENKKIMIDKKITEKLDTIKKELSVDSDYTPLKNNNFIVDLKTFEGEDLLMNIKVSVPSKNQATILCDKWQNNSADIYNDIMNILLSENIKPQS